jgi:hypothetical protein
VCTLLMCQLIIADGPPHVIGSMSQSVRHGDTVLIDEEACSSFFRREKESVYIGASFSAIAPWNSLQLATPVAFNIHLSLHAYSCD